MAGSTTKVAERLKHRFSGLFFQFWKPITIVIGTSLGVLGVVASKKFGVSDLNQYLVGAAGGLALSVLAWLWKFEIDWKERMEEIVKNIDGLAKNIGSMESKLEKEILQTDVHVGTLWRAFRRGLGDSRLEKVLRDILVFYQERSASDHDKKIVENALRTIELGKGVLERREYQVYFEAVTEYPEPFYEMANRQINATNVVPLGKFWSQSMRDDLLRLNKAAIGRIRKRLKDQDAEVVRRVFVFDRKMVEEDLADYKQVMDQQQKIGVVLKYLARDEAGMTVAAMRASKSWQRVEGLEDFTLFDTDKADLNYAGRYKDLDGAERVILVASDPNVTKELREQFEALWQKSRKYEGSIDLSRS